MLFRIFQKEKLKSYRGHNGSPRELRPRGIGERKNITRKKKILTRQKILIKERNLEKKVGFVKEYKA